MSEPRQLTAREEQWLITMKAMDDLIDEAQSFHTHAIINISKWENTVRKILDDCVRSVAMPLPPKAGYLWLCGVAMKHCIDKHNRLEAKSRR